MITVRVASDFVHVERVFQKRTKFEDILFAQKKGAEGHVKDLIGGSGKHAISTLTTVVTA